MYRFRGKVQPDGSVRVSDREGETVSVVRIEDESAGMVVESKTVKDRTVQVDPEWAGETVLVFATDRKTAARIAKSPRHNRDFKTWKTSTPKSLRR